MKSYLADDKCINKIIQTGLLGCLFSRFVEKTSANPVSCRTAEPQLTDSSVRLRWASAKAFFCRIGGTPRPVIPLAGQGVPIGRVRVFRYDRLARLKLGGAGRRSRMGSGPYRWTRILKKRNWASAGVGIEKDMAPAWPGKLVPLGTGVQFTLANCPVQLNMA